MLSQHLNHKVDFSFPFFLFLLCLCLCQQGKGGISDVSVNVQQQLCSMTQRTIISTKLQYQKKCTEHELTFRSISSFYHASKGEHTLSQCTRRRHSIATKLYNGKERTTEHLVSRFRKTCKHAKPSLI